MWALNLRRGGEKCYRIRLWLYWRLYAGAEWREVLNLAQGLDSRKGTKGSCHGLRVIISRHSPGGRWKPWAPVTKTGLWAETWTPDLSNKTRDTILVLLCVRGCSLVHTYQRNTSNFRAEITTLAWRQRPVPVIWRCWPNYMASHPTVH